MPTVQNIGAADYSQMPVVQNQIPEMEEYMNEPQVYDPEMEEKRSASGLMKGLTALGVIAGVGGTIYGIRNGKAAKTYKQTAERLEQEVASLKGKVQDEKGFKPYMTRVIKGSWLFKTLWTWPKNGILKIVEKFKGVKKDVPKP